LDNTGYAEAVEAEPDEVLVSVVSVDDGNLHIDNLALALAVALALDVEYSDRALQEGAVALAGAPSEGLLGVAPSEVLLVADWADEVLADGAFAEVAPSEDAEVAPSEDALVLVAEVVLQ